MSGFEEIPTGASPSGMKGLDVDALASPIDFAQEEEETTNVSAAASKEDPSLAAAAAAVAAVSVEDVDDGEAEGETGGDESEERTWSDSELPSSSSENVLPMEKIKNGWRVFSAWASSSASAVKAKAIETYNSESVQNFKEQQLIPAYQTTKEFVSTTATAIGEKAAPVWESTKTNVAAGYTATAEAVAPVWEATKVKASELATKAKPTVEAVGASVAAGFKQASDYVSAAASGSGGGGGGGGGDVNESYVGSPSALDSSVKGGSFTV